MRSLKSMLPPAGSPVKYDETTDEGANQPSPRPALGKHSNKVHPVPVIKPNVRIAKTKDPVPDKKQPNAAVGLFVSA